MYLIGILSCVVILLYTVRDNPSEPTFFARVFENLLSAGYQPSNNYSTILMLAMPFPVWYALKQHPVHILSCFVTSGSRAGILLGAVELVLCYLFWLRYCGTISKKIGTFSGPFLILLALIGINWFVTAHPNFGAVNPHEFRMEALEIAFREFREHPIFGIGLRNHALDEIYQPKQGALCWFHMYFPQIFASMGLVGFFAYLLQILLRSTLIFRRKKGALDARAVLYRTVFNVATQSRRVLSVPVRRDGDRRLRHARTTRRNRADGASARARMGRERLTLHFNHPKGE